MWYRRLHRHSSSSSAAVERKSGNNYSVFLVYLLQPTQAVSLTSLPVHKPNLYRQLRFDPRERFETREGLLAPKNQEWLIWYVNLPFKAV